MNRADLLQLISLAEARIKADADQVCRLKQIIADFEREDMSDWAEQARILLSQYEQMRALHVAERDALKATIPTVK